MLKSKLRVLQFLGKLLNAESNDFQGCGEERGIQLQLVLAVFPLLDDFPRLILCSEYDSIETSTY